MAGRLFLIGTPIGNLGDISLRAAETLRAVHCIFAEDTRRSRVLLGHLGIHGKKLLSFHAHSTERSLSTATEMLSAGEDLALLTDAGMPSVSDPGTELVRAARQVDAEVVVIPGPSAVTSAVALSGLVDGPFSFLGFLPRKGRSRADALRYVEHSPYPVVLFESPHRIEDTLRDLLSVCGPRQVAICRELTKKFEETLSTTLDVAAAEGFKSEWLGELTLVVSGRGQSETTVEDADYDLEGRAKQLLGEGHSVRETAQLLSQELVLAGIKSGRREVYQRVLSLSAQADSDDDEEPVSG